MSRIFLRRAACGLALAAFAIQPARADVFDLVTGSWGLIDVADLSCEVNPHQIRFSRDRSRAEFRWAAPMLSYEGDWRTEGGYDVIASDSLSVTMALDGESRRTEDGAPVVWVLRVQPDGNLYCWARTDWAADHCIDRYQRCPGALPVS